MITWPTFHPYVLPETPGVPEPIMDHVLRKSAIEFCEETALHVIDIPAIDVLADTARYALTPGDESLDIVAVKFAWFKDAPLPFISQETLNALRNCYWPAETATAPRGFTQQDQSTLILYPIPTESAAGGLKLKLIVRPSLSSAGVADWIGNRFIQEIAFGALAMLCGMVGKPWSNPEAEAKYRVQFEAAKTRATIDAYRSFTRSALQVSLRRF